MVPFELHFHSCELDPLTGCSEVMGSGFDHTGKFNLQGVVTSLDVDWVASDYPPDPSRLRIKLNKYHENVGKKNACWHQAWLRCFSTKREQYVGSYVGGSAACGFRGTWEDETTGTVCGRFQLWPVDGDWLCEMDIRNAIVHFSKTASIMDGFTCWTCQNVTFA